MHLHWSFIAESNDDEELRWLWQFDSVVSVNDNAVR